jgi:hypothetical protein
VVFSYNGVVMKHNLTCIGEVTIDQEYGYTIPHQSVLIIVINGVFTRGRAFLVQDNTLQ